MCVYGVEIVRDNLIKYSVGFCIHISPARDMFNCTHEMKSVRNTCLTAGGGGGGTGGRQHWFYMVMMAAVW